MALFNGHCVLSFLSNSLSQPLSAATIIEVVGLVGILSQRNLLNLRAAFYDLHDHRISQVALDAIFFTAPIGAVNLDCITCGATCSDRCKVLGDPSSHDGVWIT